MSVELAAWRLFEDNRRTKAGRLWHAGWTGTCLVNLSPFEEERITAFLAALPKDEWWAQWRWIDDDEHYETIGDFRYRQCCVWIKEPGDVARFDALLEANPDRVFEIVLTGPMADEHLRTLDDVNHLLVMGEHAIVLSIQDCPQAALLKLLYG